MKKRKIVVVYGGWSSEREISIISGKGVVEHLNRQKYEVVGVEIGGDDRWGWVEKLTAEKPEVVFIALHGKFGEDGTIQGILEMLGVKYVGCGVLASALGMDKLMFRKVMEREGILMPKLSDKTPCVVKPADAGSSVGVSIVRQEGQLALAIEAARKYSDRVICEELIEGTEVSCGILGGEALPVVEICPKGEFFDYQAKYTEGKCEEICPARLTAEVTRQVQEAAVRVFGAIGGKGFARVDMMIRDGVPYVLEINTIPGLTPNSLLPKEAAVVGMDYGQLLDRMIELALGR